MSTVSLKNASLSGAVKYNSLLAGNVAFEPFIGAYDLLETQTLSSSAASVTFTGLDSYTDYKHLQFRFVLKDTGGAGTSSMAITINNDTTSNYASHFLRVNSSAAISSGATTSSSTMGNLFVYPGTDGTNPADKFGAMVIDVLDFSSSSKNSTIRAITGNPGRYLTFASGGFFKTDSVTSIEFLPQGSFATNSRFSLYGIKAA